MMGIMWTIARFVVRLCTAAAAPSSHKHTALYTVVVLLVVSSLDALNCVCVALITKSKGVT